MHYLTYHFLLTFLFITSAVFKADGQNSMVDMLGQEVYNAEVANAHQHEIRVSGLNTGMYFIQVSTSAGIVTGKIQITK